MTTGIGLILAIAGALSTPEAVPPAGFATRVWVPLPDWLGYGTAAAFSLASFTIIAMTLGRRRRRNEGDYEEARELEKVATFFKALLIVLALTPGLLIGAATYWFGQSSHLPALASGLGLSAFGSMEKVPAMPASPITTWLIGALALLIGVGSFGVVLWLCFGDRLRRQRPLANDASEQLAMTVEDSLDDLRAEPDARLAILKIWRNFERVLAGAALPRRPSQTPVEFMRAVLGKMPVPSMAVRELTDLFERARFSQHPIGAEERDTAWRSLLEIRTALHEKDIRSNAAAP